jgi:hypothetical protein
VPECRRLGKLQVVCVRVVPAADETRFGGYEGEVARVSDPAWLGECQCRLVDALLAMGVHSLRPVEGGADDVGQCLIEVGGSLEGVEECRLANFQVDFNLVATKFGVGYARARLAGFLLDPLDQLLDLLELFIDIFVTIEKYLRFFRIR